MHRKIAAFAAICAFFAVLLQAPAAQANSADVGRDPVVLVHGFAGSPANFAALQDDLIRNGYAPKDIYAFQYNTYQTLSTSGQQLGTFVDFVRLITGKPKVSIISHSLGGLVTRWYVQKAGGAEAVSHVVSLAGVNHGTIFANSCTSSPPAPPSCVDMRIGSELITQLAGDETPGSGKYATWFSWCDGMIVPATSTALDGAQNNLKPCVSHGQFLTDPGVLAEVRAFLAS